MDNIHVLLCCVLFRTNSVFAQLWHAAMLWYILVMYAHFYSLLCDNLLYISGDRFSILFMQSMDSIECIGCMLHLQYSFLVFFYRQVQI